ncbi:glycosyltransferase family 4 protein [Patescibacteria group bacterium]
MNKKSTGKYFLYVGNAYPHKNLNRLVEAIVLLNKESNEKILLKIVSARGVFTKRLLGLVDRLEANEFVELLGFVSDKDLEKLYKNALAFVFPSLSEGFGLPGVEAITAKTPLLASDIPVFKEVYKDNATYFNPLDFSAIERTMRDVFNMPNSQREEMVKKASKFIERYSWAKMAKETLKIYESCTRL